MSRKFYKENNEAIPAIEYAESLPVGFTEITDPTELRGCYINKYNQRATDGINYFQDFRASLMLDVLAGTYTETEAFLLENHLKYLQSEIIAGNWLTGQNANLNLSISGIYTQVMKDEIQAFIDNYVTNNY